MSYLGFGDINNRAALAYPGRIFDAVSGSGWGDGGGDTFDNWSGFYVTINGVKTSILSASAMNDSSMLITENTQTIGGVPLTTSSHWEDREFFLVQCRYGAAQGILSFGGGIGSDGAGIASISGLIGSHGGTADPRIYWAIIPLFQSERESTTFSVVGSDPITVTTTPMTGGFGLLFSWAPVTHATVVSELSNLIAVYEDTTPRWWGGSTLQEIPILTTGFSPRFCNAETRQQAWPGEIAPVFLVGGPQVGFSIIATADLSSPPPRTRLGYIRGVVTRKGVAAAGQRVACLDSHFNLVSETRSSSNGSYRFDSLSLFDTYIVIAQDNWDFTYAPASADRRTPEAYP